MGAEELWSLWREGRLLGVVDIDDHDMFWFGGCWRPTEAFEEVAPLFAAEMAATKRDLATPQDVAEFEAAWDAIAAAGVRLHHPDGQPTAEFLLHIEDGRGRFRWSDEPFD